MDSRGRAPVFSLHALPVGCLLQSVDRMPQVFISHATDDLPRVQSEITPVLKQHGIAYWHYARSIESAAHWERSILSGLKCCDWFLLLLTPTSVQSRWVKAELDWWLDEKQGQRLIPILLDDCDWKGFHVMLRSIQITDFRQTNAQRRLQLLAVWGLTPKSDFDILEGHLVERLPSPVVDSFYQYGTIDILRVLTEETVSDYGIGRGAAYMREHMNAAKEVLILPLDAVFVKRIDFSQKLDSAFRELSLSQLPKIRCAANLHLSTFFALDSGDVIMDRPDKAYYFSTHAPRDPTCATVGPQHELLLGYADGTLLAWSRDWTAVRRLGQHSGPLCAVKSSIESTIVSACENGEVAIWSAGDYGLQKKWAANESGVSSLTVYRGRGLKCFAVGGVDGVVQIFEYNGNLRCSMKVSEYPVKALSFISSARHLAVLTPQEFQLWDCDGLHCICSSDKQAGEPTALAIPNSELWNRVENGYTFWATAGYADGTLFSWKVFKYE